MCRNPINANYFALSEKIETNLKAAKFNVNDRSELPSIRIFLLKTALKIGQEKYSLSIMC